jgi:hypothetical protein
MTSSRIPASVLIAFAALGATSFGFAQEAQRNIARSENPAEPIVHDKVEPAADKARAQPKGKLDPESAKPAQQQRKLPPRRHVWQLVGPEPTVNLGPVYSPTLTPRPPGALTPAVGPAPVGQAPAIGTAPVAPGPAPLNSCIGNLCTDASGRQYNVGTGNAGVDSQGRLCNRVGTTMQCF